jgi:hypothetical protein
LHLTRKYGQSNIDCMCNISLPCKYVLIARHVRRWRRWRRRKRWWSNGKRRKYVWRDLLLSLISLLELSYDHHFHRWQPSSIEISVLFGCLWIVDSTILLSMSWVYWCNDVTRIINYRPFVLLFSSSFLHLVTFHRFSSFDSCLSS